MIASNIILPGIYGGIVVSIWAMSMKILGFSSMNMLAYTGCLITKKSAGILTLITGILIHFMLAIAFAFAYFYVFKGFMISGWQYGSLLGLFHWMIIGMIFPLTDKMNYCVRASMIAPMKLYVSGYGVTGILTFFIGHILYGLVVGLFLIV